ncbi:MAG: hypothetical protein ACXWMG_01760 [Candidatus Limnocylindria bacterium]
MWFIFQHPDELRFRLDADPLYARQDKPLRRPLPEPTSTEAAAVKQQVSIGDVSCRGQLAVERA